MLIKKGAHVGLGGIRLPGQLESWLLPGLMAPVMPLGERGVKRRGGR